MKIKYLKLQKDPVVLDYPESFTSDDVVLDDYFVSTDQNIIDPNFTYTDNDLSLILYMTDMEYFQLSQKYLGNVPSEDLNAIESQIKQLEEKVARSKELEKNQQKDVDLEKELNIVTKDLKSYNDIERRINKNKEKLQKFLLFDNFNIDKIHDDVTSINKQINEIESGYLDTKADEIQNSYSKVVWNRGKIGLAFFWSTAFIILGFLFQQIGEFAMGLAYLSWGGGVLFLLFMLLTSRKHIVVKPNYDSYNDNNNLNEGYYTQVEELKNKRTEILSYMGLDSVDDFFSLKAEYKSVIKRLEYLEGEKKRMGEYIDIDGLKERKRNIENQLDSIRNSDTTPEVMSSDEYLATYKQIDNYKLKFNNMKNTANTNEEQIPGKITAIRKELGTRIAGFVDVVRKNFSSGYDSINMRCVDLCKYFGVPEFTLSREGVEYEQLNFLQKLFFQYSLIEYLYKDNFTVILNFSSHLDDLSDEFNNRLQTAPLKSKAVYIIT